MMKVGDKYTDKETGITVILNGKPYPGFTFSWREFKLIEQDGTEWLYVDHSNENLPNLLRVVSKIQDSAEAEAVGKVGGLNEAIAFIQGYRVGMKEGKEEQQKEEKVVVEHKVIVDQKTGVRSKMLGYQTHQIIDQSGCEWVWHDDDTKKVYLVHEKKTLEEGRYEAIGEAGTISQAMYLVYIFIEGRKRGEKEGYDKGRSNMLCKWKADPKNPPEV